MKRLRETIDSHLDRCGVSRRDFLGFCSRLMVAAPFGLAITNKMTPEAVAAEVGRARRPSVIWLHMQDCTGCSETLLRTSQPDLAELLFHVISLDYHETLMAASGYQAEAALHEAMKENHGRYVLVVEGSIPEKERGIYAKIGGKTATELLAEAAEGAAAIIAMGSCSSWGGVPSTMPNPTGAAGVDHFVLDKPIVNLPGCPPNPYVLLAVVLQYARYGTLPALDLYKRPKFAFDRVIHEHCPRRAHFDAGRFAQAFGDDGHRQGWCLYQLGCKGPMTHAACSTRHFNEMEDVWPIGIGATCIGCTEPKVAFESPLFEVVQIRAATPPDTYPPIESAAGRLTPAATAAVGFGVGAVVGAAAVVAQKLKVVPAEASGSGDLPKRAEGEEP